MLMKAVLLFLIALPCIAAQCRDDPDFTWKNEWGGTTYTLDCAFLTNSVNPQQNTKRQNNWCNKRVGRNDVLVKSKCRRSCDNCNGPNPTPSRPDNPPSPPSSCTDKPRDWQDSEGKGCPWYGRGDIDRCERFGNKRWNNGYKASTACCICGGGSRGSRPAPTPPRPAPYPNPHPYPHPAPYPYPHPAPYPNPYPYPNNKCYDSWEWHEGGYPNRDCKWYEQQPKNRCGNFGHTNPFRGQTANRACCICGGGYGPWSHSATDENLEEK